MHEAILSYIRELNRLYSTSETTEHSFRPALQTLMSVFLPKYTILNEPSRDEFGAPDYKIIRSQMTIAYVEAKDINDGDLDGKHSHKEQFSRYKAALDNIVFTDYLDFHLYKAGTLVDTLRLVRMENNHFVLESEDNAARFESFLLSLVDGKAQRITSATTLAKLMAGKARLLANDVERILIEDLDPNLDLRNQMNDFKKVLVQDLTEKTFADLYAQTISYGLFAARLYDKTPDTFTREEAAALIPHTNPFLRRVFKYIAGMDIDKRIEWIVDELVSVFAAADMKRVMRGFQSPNKQTDPLMHFYEDFLRQYDPKAKKSCGVYYTPQPVVDFIVGAVDDILKTEFNLPKGLADTSKVGDRHRVQILDPATGTGTFLAKVVNTIKESQCTCGNEGMWPAYVNQHLLPRIHGFELMMASYTIAHLKLNMVMSYYNDEYHELNTLERLKIYLTNSLEQHTANEHSAYSALIAQEANSANEIKQNPIMIVLGNPPYSVSSSNKGPWITKLLSDYKKDLSERNIQPLSDDYIKFIRLGQDFVERNDEGILAFITNNSFIDGLVHRQMRRELMRCFDKIYILDLHGNTRKKETTPDGKKDENVFDIMQGVSINIFVKKAGNHEGCEVYHKEISGKRDQKYKFLQDSKFASVDWERLEPIKPNFFFVPKDFSAEDDYRKGFGLADLMHINSIGLTSARDGLLIKNDAKDVRTLIEDLNSLSQIDFLRKYPDAIDSRDWTYQNARNNTSHVSIREIQYRPFDYKYLPYTSASKGILSYPRDVIFKHLRRPNLVLIAKRDFSESDRAQGFVSEHITDRRTWSCPGMGCGDSAFPLYLYPEKSEFDGVSNERIANLDDTVWTTIENYVKYGQANRPLTSQELSGELGFDAPCHSHFLTPEQIFDYIYGVLHSPAYRKKYKEFLKVDFPRIPYPTSHDEFFHYAEIGNQLRELHLMHNVPMAASVAAYPEEGDNLVEQPKWIDNKVYINAKQYFNNVPESAWNFYIGGYQPAQKWLKDRKGRTLSCDELIHYRKIINILIETERLMLSLDD